MTPNEEVVSLLRKMGFDVKTHANWGSRYEGLYRQRRISRPFEFPADFAASHISVTVDDGLTTGDFYTDMQELERIGFQRFNSGVSYNWVIDLDSGMIGEGQYLDARGAHTVNNKNIAGFPNNLNGECHAIAAIGMPGNKPSKLFNRSFAAILAAEQRLGFMRSKAPIYPHSMFAYKECPTPAIASQLPTIRAMVPYILVAQKGLSVSEAANINKNIDEFEAKQDAQNKQEDERYQRYEAMHSQAIKLEGERHQAQMKVLSLLESGVTALNSNVSALKSSIDSLTAAHKPPTE